MSKVYTIYMSGASGNVIAIKSLQRMELILTGAGIKYQTVDISLDENLEHKKNMISKTKSLKPTMTPQVFYNGEYIGDFEKIDEWNEYEELKQNLA